MRSNGSPFWKKYDRLKVGLSGATRVTQPLSSWRPWRLNPQHRLLTRNEMSHHLFLVRCTAPVVFALGVLAARYGRKLHGAIVEAGFFRPNLYAHLPAVSFVD